MSISRLDYPSKRMFGYYVRVQRNGVLRAKYISDLGAGGKRRALRQAREYEAELIAELEATTTRKPPRPGVRNRSGVVGVSRTTMWNGAQQAEYWQAQWRDADGRRRGMKFSVAVYGERKAFRLAVKARKAGIAAQAG
jgi:hypothetical protein